MNTHILRKPRSGIAHHSLEQHTQLLLITDVR